MHSKNKQESPYSKKVETTCSVNFIYIHKTRTHIFQPINKYLNILEKKDPNHIHKIRAHRFFNQSSTFPKKTFIPVLILLEKKSDGPIHQRVRR